MAKSVEDDVSWRACSTSSLPIACWRWLWPRCGDRAADCAGSKLDQQRERVVRGDQMCLDRQSQDPQSLVEIVLRPANDAADLCR
jgi:hypothetical protein